MGNEMIIIPPGTTGKGEGFNLIRTNVKLVKGDPFAIGDVLSCGGSGMQFMVQASEPIETDELADPFGIYYFIRLQIFTNDPVHNVQSSLEVGKTLTTW